jgi:hypothetical protein
MTTTKNAAFKVSKWIEWERMKHIQETTYKTPYDFMKDEPDNSMHFHGGRVSIIARQVGKKYTNEKKTNLSNDWYEQFIKSADKPSDPFWATFFGEVYHVAEPGSFVYYFQIEYSGKKLFCWVLTNKEVAYMDENMLQYLDATRFKQFHFTSDMFNNVGGSFSFAIEDSSLSIEDRKGEGDSLQ